MTTYNTPLEDLKSFVHSVFRKIGYNDANAALATENLIIADLRGVDSHGVARLSGYLRLCRAGRINIDAKAHIVRERAATATMDADGSLGLLVAQEAMDLAINKAQKVGTAWVAVGNSNHFGIAGQYAMMALPHDMIGFAMTNASALVAPTFGKDRRLGTNPIAVAVPSGREAPIVVDMATTTAANGKLEILQRMQRSAPLGWVQDANGQPSTDAAILKAGGAMLPLGSDREHGSHKGYALGGVVDILTGVLSGASFGPWAPPFPAYIPMPVDMPGKGLGHFFGALSIDAFQDVPSFKENMDKWLRSMRSTTPTDSAHPVLVPGDPERAAEQERRSMGIPIIQPVMDDLAAVAAELGLPFTLDSNL